MNKENILKIADYIENVDSEQFNMAAWFGQAIPKDLNRQFDINQDTQMIEAIDCWDYDHIHYFVDGFSPNRLECGTTACIAGWTNVYMFKHEENYNDIVEQNAACVNNLGNTAIEYIAAEYLGLTEAEAGWIFYTEKNSVWHQYAEEYGFKDTQSTPLTAGLDISNKEAAHVLRRIAYGEIVYTGELNV